LPWRQHSQRIGRFTGAAGAHPQLLLHADVGPRRPTIEALSFRAGRGGFLSCRQRSASSRSVTLKGIAVNKDQVKGAIKDVAGKVQEKAGEIVGSNEQQAKGIAKQVEGKAQKGLGDAKETIKDATKR
jgi:uncharacterized protein YjbJ (UPF0337 family)